MDELMRQLMSVLPPQMLALLPIVELGALTESEKVQLARTQELIESMQSLEKELGEAAVVLQKSVEQRIRNEVSEEVLSTMVGLQIDPVNKKVLGRVMKGKE